MIYPGFADVSALAEGLLSNLQLKKFDRRPPFFSEFLASFECSSCGKAHLHLKSWEGQLQPEIPLLPLPPDNNEPADVSTLLADFINDPIVTRCTNATCREPILDGRLEVKPGLYTVVAVNRFDVTDRTRKHCNKLSHSADDRDLLGELIAVVSHRGNVDRGHFVSYHKVGQNWFLNNDSRPISQAENPLRINSENETVELLFFKNTQ